jgi:DNA-binding HxlR family transcriptional regulator
MTSAQPLLQRDLAPVDAAALDCGQVTACPVFRTAQIIEGKWTTQIVRDLLPGKKRYSALLNGLPGISPKVLAQRLRFLEAQGLLVKTIYAEVPPHTDYELTALGRQLTGVIQAMAEFGVQLRTPDGGTQSSSDSGAD